MTTPILIHSSGMMVAFLVSFFIFWKKKGTKTHKILGRIFVASMAIGALSSFWIGGGDFSYIHILSILTLYWLIQGIWAVRLKQKNWKSNHVRAMGSAYIGLISAGVGVIVRHATTPPNVTNGLIATAIVVCLTVPLLVRRIGKVN